MWCTSRAGWAPAPRPGRRDAGGSGAGSPRGRGGGRDAAAADGGVVRVPGGPRMRPSRVTAAVRRWVVRTGGGPFEARLARLGEATVRAGTERLEAWAGGSEEHTSELQS